jgi:hypothetical protein
MFFMDLHQWVISLHWCDTLHTYHITLCALTFDYVSSRAAIIKLMGQQYDMLMLIHQVMGMCRYIPVTW